MPRNTKTFRPHPDMLEFKLAKQFLTLLCILLALASQRLEAQITYRAVGTNTASSVNASSVGSVAYRSAGLASVSNGGTITPGIPAGTAQGDLLVLIIQHSGTPGTLNPPSGWSTLSAASNGGQKIQAAVFWRIAPSTPTAPSVASPNGLIIGRIIAFSNVNTDTPIQSSGIQANVNKSSTPAPAVSGGIPDAAMVVVTSHVNNDCTSAGSPTPGTWTEAFTSSSATGVGGTIAAHYRPQTASGTQAAVTLLRTGCTNDDAYGVQFVINSSGFSIPVPAGTQAGDVMVATVESRPASTNFTAPTGWTQVANTSATQLFDFVTSRMATYWKVAGASEPASYTWHFSGTSDGAAGAIQTYYGVNTTTPIDAYATSTTGSGFSHAAPTVTPTVTNTMLLTLHSFTSSPSGWTPPGGMSEIIDIASESRPGTTGVTLSGNYEARSTTAATGTRTATAASSGSDAGFGITHSVLLRPGGLLNHVEVVHDGAALTCTPKAVTVLGCTTAASCNGTPANQVSSSFSFTPTATASAQWCADSACATVISGTTTVNNGDILYVRKTTTGTTQLGGSSASASNSTVQCYNTSTATLGSTTPCEITYSSAGFIISNAANSAAVNIANQIAGVSSSTYYLRAVKTSTTTKACEGALAGTQSVGFAYECNNSPNTCSSSNLMTINGGTPTLIARNNNGSVSTYVNVNMTFDANGNAPFTFSYGDVGATTLWVQKAAGGSLSTALTGSSTSFITKPYDFNLTNITCSNGTANPAATNASGGKFCPAGSTFSMTITARASGGTTTPSFGRCDSAGGTACPAASQAVTLARALVAPVGGASGTLGGSLLVASTFANGVGTFSNITWSEVGIIGLTASNANYLDNNLAFCTASPNPGDLCRGTFGVSGNVGRFYPHHFDVTDTTGNYNTTPSPGNYVVTPPPNCTGFIYGGHANASPPATLGQPFTVRVTARNGLSTPTTTTNYSSTLGFAKNVDLTLPTGGTVGTLYVDGTSGGTGAVPASKFSAGIGTVNYNDTSGKISFVFNTAPTAPTTLKIHADNTDWSTPSASTGDATIEARFGRLRLFNAFGSEKTSLLMPIQTQYWSGKTWVINSNDSCTDDTLSAANFFLSSALTTAGAISFSSGSGTLTLSAPGAGNTGSVDIAANLGASGSGNDQSCLSSHGGTPAGQPWLRSLNGNCATTYNSDPSARATFGIAPGTRRTIHVREQF